MREQLLDRFNIEYGVLTPMLGAGEHLDLEAGAALASAINDWQIAEWLDPEPRLRVHQRRLRGWRARGARDPPPRR